MAKPKTQDVQDAVNLSPEKENEPLTNPDTCLLYTSDAADE